jgi:hypothetical protein
MKIIAIAVMCLLTVSAGADQITAPAGMMMTTRSGWWASESWSHACQANDARFQPDRNAVIEQMEQDDRIFEMTGGVGVIVLQLQNGLVKFRLPNTYEEYWTSIQALSL